MTEPAAPTERTEPTLDSTTRADQSDELATTTMMRGAIGPIQTDYYLRHFTRFDSQDRAGASWNTAAALTTLNWMLFRKMWNPAIAYTGIALTVALLVFGIGKLVFHYPPEVQWALAGLYLLLLVAIPGFWGNALLFRQVRSDMAGALSANQSIAEAADMLQSRAPTRRRLIVLAALNVALGALVLAVALWAKDFQADPLGIAAESAPAPTAAANPAASGNVAVGKAIDAASAPQVPASAPSPAPAVTPAVGTSAPAVASTVAAAALTPASAPAAAASAAQPVASAPARSASAPQPVASAPAKAASSPATSTTPNNGKSSPRDTPHSASAAPAKPASTAPEPKTPSSSSKEKAEATKLAPQSAAQQGRKPAPESNTKKATAPKPDAPAPIVTGKPADAVGVPEGRYGINVGLFADPNNARNAFVKLSDAGLPAYTQELQGKKGPLTRVRVGPFDSMAEAERYAARIRGMGLEALVFQQGKSAR